MSHAASLRPCVVHAEASYACAGKPNPAPYRIIEYLLREQAAVLGFTEAPPPPPPSAEELDAESPPRDLPFSSVRRVSAAILFALLDHAMLLPERSCWCSGMAQHAEHHPQPTPSNVMTVLACRCLPLATTPHLMYGEPTGLDRSASGPGCVGWAAELGGAVDY